MTRAAREPGTSLTVELDAIAHNLAAVRALLEPGVRVAGVVKADAYGHGMLPVSRRLLAEGVEALAVALLSEARVLRKGGIAAPVMVLTDPWPDRAREVVALGVMPVIDRWETLEALAAAGDASGRTVRCLLKVDTGMGRLGVEPRQALEFLERAAPLRGLELVGLVSHLATAGEPDDAHAARQARRFAELLAQARQRGFALPDSSLCASGGSLVPPPGAPGPPCLVRVGIALYGGLPSPGSRGVAELRTAMRFATRLHAVRSLRAGQPVSYGCTWTAPEDTWLGVLPVGYADGYPRAASNRAQVLIRGRRLPVRGRVCMNLMMVELAGLEPLPQPGEEVVLLGRQGEEEITLDQLGGWAGTIGYEVACALGAANPPHHV